MKKLILGMAMMCGVLGFSQDAEERAELMDAVSNEACECIDKKQASMEEISESSLEMLMGLCILESYAGYAQDFKKFGISLDGDGAEQLGEEIGMSMMVNCPTTMMLLVEKYMEDEIGEEYMIEEAVMDDDMMVSNSSSYAFGKIKKISSDQFRVVEFRDEDGKKHNLLWLTYVENSEILEDFSKRDQSDYRVEYQEIELYDTKLGEYRVFKVIAGIWKE